MRFAAAAVAAATVQVAERWELPLALFDGNDRKAEGLVVLPGPAFLVAFDSDQTNLDNLALAAAVG